MLDKKVIVEKPLVALREFFSTKDRPVTLPEFQAYWASCTEQEKANARASIAKWDGQSEFIAA